VTMAAKSGQYIAGEMGRASSFEETERIWQKNCDKNFISRQQSGYALSLQ